MDVCVVSECGNVGVECLYDAVPCEHDVRVQAVDVVVDLVWLVTEVALLHLPYVRRR